jgi:antibiotic biosynthesis monooxygenase (ABM) superfamily enzyme
MSVCVVIRRTVRDEKIAASLAPLIVKLRSLAAIQPGYITDQAFSCLDCDGEYMVVSIWDQIESWNRWMHSDDRLAIQRRVDELTGEKTVYRYYEPIVGGILPKFEPKNL